MATDNKNVEVKKGDQIAIRAQGITIKGTVISANWYGPTDGWYIETSTESGGYSYWKQGQDGGQLRFVNGLGVYNDGVEI